MKSVLYLILLCTASGAQGTFELSPLSDTIPVNKADKNTADSVFAFIRLLNDVIDFDDCNICKSRAHIITGIIEKQFPSVKPGKVWLITDCRRLSKAAEYKYKPLVFLSSKGLCTDWIYHVAPVIITGTDTLVIDPATQKKAVNLGEWIKSLIPAEGSALAVLKHKRYFIYPDDDNNNFIDDIPVWTDDKENLLDEHYSRSIDEMVRVQLGIIEPWKMNVRVKKIKELIY